VVDEVDTVDESFFLTLDERDVELELVVVEECWSGDEEWTDLL
tara:strand:- start:78 stop:206 length:129 start_codon:yes stop_codon:yes gene_type:complete